MYFQYIENIFTTLKTEDQNKIKFVKSLTGKLNLLGINDCDSVTLGPMDYRMFEYLIFAVVLEYDNFKILNEE